MKNRPPAASKPARTAPATSQLWRNLAIVLGASTLALAIFLVRVSTAFDTLAAQSAAKSAPAAAALPRELTPFAALGSNMAENNRIADLGWTPAQFDAFLAGLRSSYEGRGVPMNDDALRLRDQLSQRVQAMLAADNPEPLEAYFRTLRDGEGVQRTASGLHYRITEPGEGTPPRPEDTVVVSITSRLPDGTELPTISQARMRAAVRDLLPGIAEGVQLMSVGGKALIYVPPRLGFGERPPPPIPPGAPIVTFVELHDIMPPSP